MRDCYIAVSQVLTVLSEAPYFRRVLQVPAFISVPNELADDVSEVLVDIRQRFPSLSKAEWVDKPGYASIPGMLVHRLSVQPILLGQDAPLVSSFRIVGAGPLSVLLGVQTERG